jgi:hypothetical protein
LLTFSECSVLFSYFGRILRGNAWLGPILLNRTQPWGVLQPWLWAVLPLLGARPCLIYELQRVFLLGNNVWFFCFGRILQGNAWIGPIRLSRTLRGTGLLLLAETRDGLHSID